MIPLELVYDHATTRDKKLVAVDGGNHDFLPCRPEFGDSRKRTFDYVDGWLARASSEVVACHDC